MLPLSPRPSLPTYSVSEITPTSPPTPKENILFPLIEKTSDGSFIWKLNQDPILITEENYEKDLQQSLRRTIEKRGSVNKTDLVDFEKKFLNFATSINQIDFNSSEFKLLLEQVIPIFEELIWRDDIDFIADTTDIEEEDFFHVKTFDKIDFEIHNDQEAYIVFLFYVVCVLTRNGQHIKFFKEIISYIDKTNPQFENNFFLKKMTFLGLSRTMDEKILITMISREAEKNPETAPFLLALAEYLKQKVAKYTAIMEILSSEITSMAHDAEIKHFKAFMAHYKTALYAKGPLSEYRNFIKIFSTRLISLGKQQIVIDMCDMTLNFFPDNKSILKIKESIQKGNTFIHGMQSQGLNSSMTELETPTTVNISMNNGKIYDLNGQTILRPLISYDDANELNWDFHQNDGLLDKETWSTRLIQEFLAKLEKQYQDIKPTTKLKSNKNQVSKFERVTILPNAIFDISGTSFVSLLPTKKGKISLVDLFDRLFLQKMWVPLNACLDEALKPSNKKYLTNSDDTYIFYICLMVGLYLKDNSKLQTVNTVLEVLSNRPALFAFSPFLEKLQCLIYAQSLIGNDVEDQPEITSKIVDFLNRSLVKINAPQLQGLLILKAEYLIDSGDFKRCRVLLESLPISTKEKPEYLKVLCKLEFACGAWQEAIKIGENYFELCHQEDLRPEDLSVAYALSNIYRYHATIGNGVLINRLINSLKSPSCALYHENYLRHFYGVIFNIYYNPFALEFSTHQIPYVDGESPSMRSVKEVALHTINRLTFPTIMSKNNMTIDERVATLLADSTISAREEVSYIAELCYIYGCAHFKKKNYATALELFEKVDKMVRHHMHAFDFRIRTLLHLAEYAKAYQLLKKCLKNSYVQKNWIELHVGCLISLDRKEEALVIAKNGFEENPQNTNLLLLEIKILSELENKSELVETSRVALEFDLKRHERLDILRNIFDPLLKNDPVFLETHLKSVLDNSWDDLEIEAFYLLSMLQIRNNHLQKAKDLLAGYKKNDYIKFFLQAEIEYNSGENEQALISLAKSLELKPKVKEKAIYDTLVFFIPEIDFKKLQYRALGNLGRLHELLTDNFNWVHAGIPEPIFLVVFKKFLEACNDHNRLDLGLKACDKLLKIYKRSTYIKTARENILAELENEKAITLAAKSIPPVEDNLKTHIDPSVEIAESPKKSEDPKNKQISFDFSKKPKLYLEKKKENNAPLKMPTHPALIKQMEADLKQAKMDIAEMYRLEPTQLEVHYRMSDILTRNFGPFAEYGKEESISESGKSAPKPPKEPVVKTAPKELIAAHPTRLTEAPKRFTKSLEAASRQLGIELPIMAPSPYLDRFKGAQIAATELCDNLIKITKENSRVHPLYKDPQFASRYLSIHLFRMVELMKPTVEGLTSEIDFKIQVEQVFTECRNVVLLRNLITLQGHRTSFEDLKKFCRLLSESSVPGNLTCLSDGKKTNLPPFRFDLRELFPIAFKDEWESLSAPAQMKALLAMINLELDFLGMHKSDFDLLIFEEKGRDVCEVIKISVLRIGKAFSYMANVLNVRIFDSEFNEITEASFKVRHQITKPNAAGLPRELQPKWLSAFISKHDMLRERIKWKFASWL